MKKRIYRSETDRKIAGVCGGIAEYFDIDSTVVRLAVIFMMLAWGTGLVAYIAAAIIMPTESEVEVIIKKNSRKKKDN